MPVEFISATHISDDHRKVGAGFGGFDPDYTRRFVRALDDGGFDWTLVRLRLAVARTRSSSGSSSPTTPSASSR